MKHKVIYLDYAKRRHWLNLESKEEAVEFIKVFRQFGLEAYLD